MRPAHVEESGREVIHHHNMVKDTPGFHPLMGSMQSIAQKMSL
jgi:hypothetical protein